MPETPACPYYVCHDGMSVSCDFIMPGQIVTSTFGSEPELEQALEEWCRGDYKSCPMYQRINGFLDGLGQAVHQEQKPKKKEVGRGSAVKWIE